MGCNSIGSWKKESLRSYRHVVIIVVVALPSASSSRRLLRCDRCRYYPVDVWLCLGSSVCLSSLLHCCGVPRRCYGRSTPRTVVHPLSWISFPFGAVPQHHGPASHPLSWSCSPLLRPLKTTERCLIHCRGAPAVVAAGQNPKLPCRRMDMQVLAE